MSEFHVEVGAYALDALDDIERNAFERHLAGCETCQRELAEFSQTTALLGALGDVAPPSGLRSSLLDAIREIRPLPPPELPRPGGEEVARPASPRRAAAVIEAGDAEPFPADLQTTPGGVDELALRRQTRRARLLGLAVAAVTVVALALGGWVYVVHHNQQVVAGQDAATTRLLSAADAQTYPVTVGGSPATFVVSKSLNQAMFIGADMPTAATGRTYQAWTVNRGQTAATPNVTFVGGSETRVFLTGNVDQAVGLALSDEPAGGSLQPTRIITQVKL